MTRNPAVRRYNRSVLILSLAYAALLFAAEYVIGVRHLSGAPTYAVAILPALPIIGMFAAIGCYLVEERDEYLRVLAVRQSLVASALALTAATAWGFLESFDLAAHLDAYWVAVVWFGGLGVGAGVNKVLGARA